MSLGGPLDTALDAAVKVTIAKGIHTAIAAGNSFIDACDVSPARVPEAYVILKCRFKCTCSPHHACILVYNTTILYCRVTVGAIDINNEAYFNYGKCVDISAPVS